MKNTLTVSQLNKYIKDIFWEDSFLYSVKVQGEISNLKKSGANYYFSLKDDRASINAIVFANVSVDMTKYIDGMKVEVSGQVQVYEKAGTYAIYVKTIEDVGLGEYYLKLQELTKKLGDMGMFDDVYKKPIKKYNLSVGVLTSKTGAAIKDIIKTIHDRNPWTRIFLYPTLVQGENAYKSIVTGLMELDSMNLDVIILGRGGGSKEDLFCFNDERVAYAIFNAKTPIISAVGHEIDVSIADLVADVRVATPTAAGVLASFDYREFLEMLDSYKTELKDIVKLKIENIKNDIENRKLQIELKRPQMKIKAYKEKLQYDRELLKNNITKKLIFNKNRLGNYIEMMRARNVLDKIKKGFVWTTNKVGKKLSSINDINISDNVYMRLVDGKIVAKVIDKENF